MLEQVTGAVLALVIVSAYIVVVEALCAAMLLLGQFTILQARALRQLVATLPRDESAPSSPAVAVDAEGTVYRVGGHLKW